MFRPVHVFTRTVGAAENQPGTAVSASPAQVNSLPSTTTSGRISWEVTADADGAGTLDGTFVIQYSQSTHDEIKTGTDTWANYTPNDASNAKAKAIPAIALTGGAAVSHLLEVVHAAAGRYRIQFNRTAGSGLVYARVLV